MIERLKQPEYTEENRCIPCTIINTVLSVIFAVLTAVIAASMAPAFVAFSLSVAVLAGSLVLIWLRGYLIPHTPELTKRYMPLWVLSWFGKDSTYVLPNSDAEPLEGEQLEAILRHEGILTPCDDKEDLCLTSEFVSDWKEEVESVGDEIQPERGTSMLGLDVTDGAVDDRDDGSLVIKDGGESVGKWPSEAAFRADLASASVLAEKEFWESLPPIRRAEMLHTIRLFIDVCPDGNPTTMKEQTVESCCSSYEVAVVVCERSGDRLFEQPVHE